MSGSRFRKCSASSAASGRDVLSSRRFAVPVRHLSCLASCRWFDVASRADYPVTASIPTIWRGSGESRSDWNGIGCLRMLPASFCISESTPRRINMAKKKAAGGGASNGSAANLGFEAKLWLTNDKLRNNMDAAESCWSRCLRRTRGESTIRAAARRLLFGL